jgi:hypothetical protein
VGSIRLIPAPKVTELRFFEKANAFSSIIVTLSGTTTERIDESKKA